MRPIHASHPPHHVGSPTLSERMGLLNHRSSRISTAEGAVAAPMNRSATIAEECEDGSEHDESEAQLTTTYPGIDDAR